MKTIIRILLLVFLCTYSIKNYAINPISPEAYNLSTISVDEYLDMNYKQLKSISDKGLKLKDRMGFIVTKKYLKLQLSKDKINRNDNFISAAGGFEFSFGGFLLGLLLGIFGLLIVALLFKKPRKNAVLSALIGMLISGVLFGIGFSI